MNFGTGFRRTQQNSSKISATYFITFNGFHHSCQKLRGSEISFDLKTELLKHNISCEEYLVYKQKRSFQQEQLDKILGRKNLKGIALFSEKSVDSLLKSSAGQNLEKTFFCFSKKIEKVYNSSAYTTVINHETISNQIR